MFRKINNNYTVIPEPVFNENRERRERIEQLFINIDNRELDAKERYKLKNELYGYTVPVQLLGKRKDLLHDIYVNGKKMQKLDIWLLKGVTYTYDKGAEFLIDYKEKNNIL